MSVLQVLALLYSKLGFVVVPHGPDDGPPPAIGDWITIFGGEPLPSPFVLVVAACGTEADWDDQVRAILGETDGRYSPGPSYVFSRCTPIQVQGEVAA